MQVIVDKHTVTIVKNEIVNEGEYNVQSCNFQFSSEYDGLPKIAIFKTNTVTKQIMLSGNTCITPEEVLQTTGIVGLGIYAYQTDGDNLILRYSPTPAVFTVEPGSYDEGDAPTPPTPSEIEQLQAQITENANNISSLQEVVSTYATQIETLQTDVNNIKAEQITQNANIQTNANDISNIKSEQITQNNNIQANADDITTLQNDLSSEVTNRQNADNNLQSQIDAITVSSDVIDVLGTYQDLVNYDTSHVKANDIIKVLQDSTHNNSMSYYRWVITQHVGAWVYVGSEGPYYTKSETDSLLQEKANSSDVYTKTQIDTTLENYATKTDIENFITEQEVDTKLENYVDTTTFNQSQSAQDTNINLLQSLVNQMPTVEATGTDISLQDVLNYRFMKFVMKGNSSQFSTTGKQLFDVSKIEVGKSWFGGSNNARARYYITYNPGEAYTISFINIPSEIDSVAVVESSNITDTTGNKYSSTIDTTQSFTHTFNSNAVYLILQFQANVTFTREIANKITLQIEQGSSATPYEPYTDGPAPNPSYPYPVKTVTGENSLVICNENLFDKNDVTNRTYLDSNGNLIENYTWSISNYINVIPTFNYTYKGLTDVGTAPMSCYYDENKNFISSFKQATGINTISIPSNAKYIRFTVKQQASNDLNTFMFVKGSTAPSEYIAHEEQTYQLSLGTMELCKIGDYQDYIYKSGDNWYKREYIGKTTDTSGSTSITINDMLSNGSIYSYYGGTVSGKTITYSSSIPGENTIYYQKAEYTDIQITDTTLITQLNNIYNNAQSYNGTTNITSTYEDGNEQMYLDIEALKNVWEVTE